MVDETRQAKPDDAVIRRLERAVTRLGCEQLKPYARWRLGYAQDRPEPPSPTETQP